MRRLPQVCHLEVKWSWEVDGGGGGDGNMWERTAMNEFQYSASMCSSTMRWAIWNVVRALQSRAEQSRARGRRGMTGQVTPFHFIGSKGEERRYIVWSKRRKRGNTYVHGKAGGSIGWTLIADTEIGYWQLYLANRNLECNIKWQFRENRYREAGSCEKRRRDKVKVGGKEGCARHTVGNGVTPPGSSKCQWKKHFSQRYLLWWYQ